MSPTQKGILGKEAHFHGPRWFVYLAFRLIVCTMAVLFRRLATLTGMNLPVLASRPTCLVEPFLLAILTSLP